jgi:hypothetical protein
MSTVNKNIKRIVCFDLRITKFALYKSSLFANLLPVLEIPARMQSAIFFILIFR